MTKKKNLLNSAYFRASYERFYQEMRNYLWDLPTLEILADVQEITYQAFIDLLDLHDKLSRLYQCIRETASEDDYLKDAYDSFNDLVEENLDTQLYCTLYQVEEA